MSAELVAAPTLAPEGDDQTVPPRVVAGGSWRNTHEVLAAREGGDRRWFRARNLTTNLEEWLWVTDPGSAGRRDEIWSRLRQLECSQLQRTVACHVGGGERVEVWADAGGVTLRAWRTARSGVDAAEVTALIRDLALGIASLHQAGVGHFAINPDNIVVLESAGNGPAFCLTGFESAELFAGTGLITIPVDPGSAPPEAAGLAQHSPGPLLGAWDYWSLGRVVQEFILGHAVLDLLPPLVRSRLPLSLAGQAESLLTERETGAIRAGAVELMPGLARREMRLLRGLLTGAREGRWGAIEVTEWLEGGEPGDHYDAPRHRRFFRLDDRAYSVAEAAALLAGPARHGEVVAHVFSPERGDTLAGFLEETRSQHQAEQEQVDACRKLVDLPAFARVSDALRREVAAAIGLHILGRGAFRWRGQELNESTLRAACQDDATFARLGPELRVLSLPLVLELMRKHDAVTADFIDQLRHKVEEAEALQARHGWAGLRSRELWQAALEPAAALRERLARMHGRFACSSLRAMDALFQAPHPAPAMEVLLAWADGDAGKFGFKTHEQVREEELARLQRTGRVLAQALFWHRLEQALRAVPLLFAARWVLLVAGIALIAALAVHLPGPTGVVLGFGPLAILVGLRVALNRWQAHLVHRWTGGNWSWRDGAERCQRERRALVGREQLPTLAPAVRAALASLDQRRAELLRPGRAEPVARPPRQWATWGGALLVWLLLLGIAAGSSWRTVVHPPVWSAHVQSWHSFTGRDDQEAKPADPRISWPYRVPLKPDLFLSTAEVFAADSRQEDYALERGRRLAANYRPDTITSLLAVYVPLDDRRGGLLMYDARKAKIVGKKGPVLNFVPMPKSWLSLEGQIVIFIEK